MVKHQPIETSYKRDDFYFFSDGVSDQFGGDGSKNFGYKPLEKLLIELSKQPMDKQKFVFEKTLLDWMGKTIQT